MTISSQSNGAVPKPTTRRVRGNLSVLNAALKSLQEHGYTVDKLCIASGHVDISVVRVAATAPTVNHSGLEPKQWE
jgi:hypothetical protein